jgi:hypothetical protein
MRHAARSSTLLLLGALLASGCSGSSSSAPSPAPVAPAATRLAYADPAGSGWRLVRNAASTSTRLVLDLVGPSGQHSRGVGFNLPLPAGIKAGTFDGGLLLRDTGVYELLSAANDPGEPVALVGGVTPGRKLSVGIYQKDRARSAKDSGAALLQVALLLDASQPPPAGSTLALSIPKARFIPEEIGQVTDETFFLDLKMRMVDAQVAVGTLTAE